MHVGDLLKYHVYNQFTVVLLGILGHWKRKITHLPQRLNYQLFCKKKRETPLIVLIFTEESLIAKLVDYLTKLNCTEVIAITWCKLST